MKQSLIVWLSLGCAWGGIYVKDQQYRFCANGGCEAVACEELVAPGCNKGETTLPVVEKFPGYKIVYLEYRENGDRWDNAELEAAKKLIDRERRGNAESGEFYGGPITLFLYVHGWKNNANERPAADPGDVERFRRYLAAYVATLRPEIHRPVVGVYIAWHGKSLDLPGAIDWVSFWTRSAGALRVGKGKLNADFGELVQVARQRRQTEPAGADTPGEDPNRQTRVIVLSHSFGARVLQTALIGADPSKGVTTGTCKGLVHGVAQRPPVDLVLFENAATGAGAIWRQFNNCQPCGDKRAGCRDSSASSTDFSRTVMMRSPAFVRAACRTNPGAAGCQPYPLLVSISAKNDLLTRVVLAIAAGQHPAPFLWWLQTHQVREVPPRTVADPAKGQVFTFESAAHTYLVERKPGMSITPANAIWSMQVDKEIINQHGDVWNDNFLNFQINLISSTDRTKAEEHRAFDSSLNRVKQPAH